MLVHDINKCQDNVSDLSALLFYCRFLSLNIVICSVFVITVLLIMITSTTTTTDSDTDSDGGDD